MSRASRCPNCGGWFADMTKVDMDMTDWRCVRCGRVERAYRGSRTRLVLVAGATQAAVVP